MYGRREASCRWTGGRPRGHRGFLPGHDAARRGGRSFEDTGRVSAVPFVILSVLLVLVVVAVLLLAYYLTRRW